MSEFRPLYTITDKNNKVRLDCVNVPEIPPRLIFKSQLVDIRISEDFQNVIIVFSGSRLILSYEDIATTQRTLLGINSNEDLINYFDLITI